MSDEAIQAWLTLHDRAAFAREFLPGLDGKTWRPRPYQLDSLRSYGMRKVHCDGRDVGKTTEIELLAAWACVARPNSEMLIATQCENHLFPLMERILRRIRNTPCLAPILTEAKRTPSWCMRFRNGFVLWGRIAGPHGMNFQGLHVDWQVVDEAQEMTESAWGELYQALNGGGRRWVYGVPNGLRNTFYRMTQMPESEQYNWPSTLNPEYTAEKDAELARLYGGKDSPGYIHRVLGQHGAPEHAVFNLDDYLACVAEVDGFADIEMNEGDAFAAPPGVVPGRWYLGCDLGYARDPSEFVVYRAEGPDLVNALRVHLRGVNYARQQTIIEELDRAYRFQAIGIDCGNNGRAIAHGLMQLGHGWCDRVFAIEFGAHLEVATLPDGQVARRMAKQFMTELLERRMAERTIVFPPLAARESQYAGHTYSVGASGQVVYSKGHDHLIDADRCALLAHFHDTHRDGPPHDPGVRLHGF